MNITIFSGGTGSIALQRGLNEIYPKCKITNIINLYDDGKSTRIARRVCDCLGPSDLRKNHLTQYLYNTDKNQINQNIVDFYEKRFDLSSNYDTALTEVLHQLEVWNFSEFNNYAIRFFENAKRKNINNFKDFAITNIIYAEMFKEHGVNYTNEYFTKFLNLTLSEVLVNSEENLNLSALTNKNRILADEVEILDLKDPNEKIVKTLLNNLDYYNHLNPKIIDNLNNADIIILSAGTQWSSLIPSYMNKDIQNCLNKNSHKIIFVVNVKEDVDMYGCSSIDMINAVSNYINLDNSKILYNSDATETLQEIHPKYKFYKASMKNNNGKHDPHLLAINIFKMHFNLENVNTKNIFLDFDDTLYARNKTDIEMSIQNALLMNKLSDNYNFTILSGNSYKHIHERLSKIFSANLANLSNNIKIWADWCLVKYENGNVIKKIKNKNITNYSSLVDYLKLLKLNNKEIIFRGPKDYLTSIAIKPLNNRERIFLSELLNIKFPEFDSVIAGTTTLEIVSKNTSKIDALKEDIQALKDNSLIFIGDECANGNDAEVYSFCKNNENYYPINVKNIYETNVILQILGENL